MNKEKQSEKQIDILANDIYQHCPDLKENYCGDTHCVACLANALYNEGYRKQSENTVEVIRCKDCEHWTEVSFDPMTEWHWGECQNLLGTLELVTP